ncbi:MAG: DUF4157 domain-containing protein, partial [Phaeodactylibacter sp.]|nr:DUF4157 domain-containing protein [Phaeodactylibacter sp.]
MKEAPQKGKTGKKPAKSGKPFIDKSQRHGFIQPQLTIGRPGDHFEQEADVMANRVMSMPEQAVQRQEIPEEEETLHAKPLAEGITPLVQRQAEEEEEVMPKLQRQEIPEEETIQEKCADCEEKEMVQRQENPPSLKLRRVEEEELQPKLQRQEIPQEEEEILPKLQRQEMPEEEEVLPMLQRQERPPSLKLRRAEDEELQPTLQRQENGPLTAPPELESRLHTSKGQGAPLPENTRASMENAFGSDFSGVRVHTGPGSVQMNQELSAQAFTHGSDVYFNAGKYSPASGEGKRLLAHELTHVVQ